MASAKTLKIEFTRDYIVDNADRTEYKAGQVETMNERSALHFINRGAAVLHDPKAPAKSEDGKPATAGKKKVAKKKASKKAD